MAEIRKRCSICTPAINRLRNTESWSETKFIVHHLIIIAVKTEQASGGDVFPRGSMNSITNLCHGQPTSSSDTQFNKQALNIRQTSIISKPRAHAPSKLE